jgi:hypothetical protein
LFTTVPYDLGHGPFTVTQLEHLGCGGVQLEGGFGKHQHVLLLDLIPPQTGFCG